MRVAHASAAQEGAPLLYSHLKTVTDAGKEFEADFKGGQSDNMRSYF